jgi:HK97 family phage major capsid protein
MEKKKMAENDVAFSKIMEGITKATQAAVAPLATEVKELKEKGVSPEKVVELETKIKGLEEQLTKKTNAAADQFAVIMDANRKSMGGSIDIEDEKSVSKAVGQIVNSIAGALNTDKSKKFINNPEEVMATAQKFFPNSKALHEIMKKDLEAGIPSAGGYGIPQILLPTFVPYLYKKTLLDKFGVTKYPMPAGNLRIARIDSTSSVSWGGELPKSNKTQPALGDVVLNSKKLTAVVPYSNTLFRNQQIGLDGLIASDLQRVATIATDTAALYGLGNQYQPLGLENVSGIQAGTTDFGTSTTPIALSVQFPIDMVAFLEQANVPMENPVWLLNPTAKGWMMGKAFSTGPFAWANEMATNKTLNGIPFYSSATVANHSTATVWANIWLGDFSEFIWGVSYDIAIDVSREGSYTDSGGTVHNAWQSDETLVRLITEMDFNVKHPVSFIETFVKQS